MKLTLRLLFIITLLLKSIYANSQNIDSLKRVLKAAKNDTTKIRLEFEIGDALKISRTGYWDSLTIRAKKTSMKKITALCLNNSGLIYIMQGNTDLAMKLCNEALQIAEQLGDKKAIANAQENIGGIYTQLGDIVKALEYHFLVLKLREEIKDKEGIAQAMNNIAYIYGLQGEFDKADEFYAKILKYREETNNQPEVVRTLLGMSFDFRSRGDTLNTIKCLERALKISETIGDKYSVATTLGNLGVVYGTAGKLQQAQNCFFKSLKLQEELGDVEGKAYSLHNIGDIFFKQKNMPQAVIYANKSLAFAKELKYPAVIKISAELLLGIYTEQGKYKEAFEMQRLYIHMRDSLNNDETKRATIQTQFQYEFEKKESAIKAEQDKKDAIATEEKRRQQVVTYAISAVLVLVFLLAIFIFRSFRIKQKANIELAGKNDLIEKQKHVVEEKQKEILDSITYAKRLQQAILPSLSDIKKLLPDSFLLYQPKDIVAGDFYWMEHLNGITFIAAADSTGHGVPGAMVSVVCSNALNRTVKEFKITEPGKILDKVRELVIETFEKSKSEVKDGMDISLAAIHQNSDSQGYIVEWAGANNPLWYFTNNVINEITADKQPIGNTDNPKPFTTHKLQLSKGDIIYLFTDGYADQFGGPKGKKFKYKQFQELLIATNSNTNLSETEKVLYDTFTNWKGNLEQVDDVCIIGIRV